MFNKAFANAEIPSALSDASSAVSKIIEIVHAMKAMTHAGKVEHEPVDVNSLIQDASVIARNSWKYVASLEMNLDEHLPYPYGDRAELSQIILNLLVNASDAIEERYDGQPGVGVIEVNTYSSDDVVYIEVSDNGIGIPEELQQRVFDPFFTTKDVGKGTGQGLAFVYQSVLRHHGDVQVESTPGVGTVFRVCLPIAENGVLPQVSDSVPSTSSRKSFPIEFREDAFGVFSMEGPIDFDFLPIAVA
ncbi:sensor histidine kinase [Aeoliella mucimassa]|uniref:histidine kinase n=1 Tax=Aeoliella mucimassa TaxID=2527972 RepID=A0A518APA8_9BACT|nr:ATP-binding protein [Aeoliella mucimassa]QDU56563.1 Blue-light-activated protein [Aeoliella mucimassa]